MDTLILLKPDVVRKNYIGKILAKFEENGFKIKRLKMLTLNRDEASDFYSVHKNKSFFSELVDFITSGPIVAAIIEGDNAIERVRELIGSTKPSEAKIGTIRREFGSSITENAIHASDSHESFIREVRVVFPDYS
ncbi:MAG: nucleoside-diphosphate kinase [Candidatus Nitrosocaldaceae archaeon]